MNLEASLKHCPACSPWIEGWAIQPGEVHAHHRISPIVTETEALNFLSRYQQLMIGLDVSICIRKPFDQNLAGPSWIFWIRYWLADRERIAERCRFELIQQVGLVDLDQLARTVGITTSDRQRCSPLLS